VPQKYREDLFYEYSQDWLESAAAKSLARPYIAKNKKRKHKEHAKVLNTLNKGKHM
jgi:hypothetical protein